MVRLEAPPKEQASPKEQAPFKEQASPGIRVLLLPVLLVTAVTALVVVLAEDTARIPLALYGAGALVVIAWCALELARRRRVVGVLHERYAHRISLLEGRLAQHDEESVRLGKELMPAAVYRLRQGESPDEVIRAVVDGDERYRELPLAQRALLKSVLQIVDDEEAMRESAQRAFVNIARRVQSLVHQQASELREMENAHGRNPEVFDDLLRIDHGTALIGRLADSIAVLGKARPGRQWPRPVPLFSVLRGAMSRILEYQRVDLHSIAKIAIIGTAVEPLIHACAELLDNATRYSPPQTRVHVTAVEVQTGIAIEIEDGGVSLSEEARARAESMLARAQAGIDLNDLGDTPRLGMAVVGRLCQMYHLQVSLRQSAYGGVRAVLIVPRSIVTTGPAPGIAHGIGASALPRGTTSDLPTTDVLRPANRVPRPVTGPQRPAPVAVAGEDDAPVVTEWTENGLPQRRSRGRAPLGSHNLGLHSAGPRGGDRAYGPSTGGTNAGTNGATNGQVHGAPYGHGGAGAPAGTGDRTPEGKPGPGIWLEAFTKAVNGTPGEPPAGTEEPPGRTGDHGESDDVRGKGDLK
ncbi:ATP-binding protein [Streptomyces sp. JV176]|uniref:sensor histidine kinase n=1 Tax=Streptomyces sp. JV176 TaxID=858630 RepID=UPI002E75C4D0|nr:ATP-binding protein [Streptomyces sp. JV176]MEE1803105.1 ATP-binding protein [Streptomyces sp. JV176]